MKKKQELIDENKKLSIALDQAYNFLLTAISQNDQEGITALSEQYEKINSEINENESLLIQNQNTFDEAINQLQNEYQEFFKSVEKDLKKLNESQQIYIQKLEAIETSLNNLVSVYYTVTFDSNGGTVVESQTIIKDGKIKTPQNPTYEGYCFSGWYLDDVKWDFKNDLVTDNITLKAKWIIPSKYKITYYVDGGSLIDAEESYDEATRIILKTPTKTGYKFLGWYDNENFTGEKILLIDFNSNGDKEFYAKWEIVNYSIFYQLFGGLVVNAPLIYNVTSNIILPTPSKIEYYFAGWYDNENFTGEKITVINPGTVGDLHLYAKWIKADISSTTKWEINQLGFSGNGAKFGIKVDDLTFFDPFNSSYQGEAKALKQAHLVAVESAYGIDIQYIEYTDEEAWGVNRISSIKNSFIDTTFRQNEIYVVEVAHQ